VTDRALLDRVSPDDLMSLVGDTDTAPIQVGVVLVLDDGATLDPAELRAALARRLSAVPRLRRRLAVVPLGCGRPVWLDQPGFDIEEHFSVHRAPRPLTHVELLDLAGGLVARPLARDRPLWRATLVPEVEPGRAALVVVFHHVLADGLGGLAILADLLASGPAPVDPAFPRREPTRGDLRRDAWSNRLRSLSGLPATLGRLRAAVREITPTLHAVAEACSLNQPTGPTRSLRTATADLGRLRDLAHRHGATVNDVLLTATAGALNDLLAGRGEHLRTLVISVPFSTRSAVGRRDPGNHSGVVAVRLSTDGSFADRLAEVAAATRAAKRDLPGATTAILAPAFRLLDRLGLYRRFVDHQRLIHTFVSNMRGPDQPLELLGRTVTELIPLSVTSGNVTVAFTSLSYCGRLVTAISADPDTCPDLERLQRALTNQLSNQTAEDAASLVSTTLSAPVSAARAKRS
jgi:diacylglycerol O-acyltransferase